MRLLYIVLLCSVMNMPAYAAEDNGKKQECSIKSDLGNIKSNLGKILLCVLATIYKHPFMTAWSVYATSQTIHNHRRKNLFESRGLITWIIDALLLGDFAHNVLHTYKINHYSCTKEVSNCTNPVDI